MIKLYIAGHNGMVGNSLLNCFNKDSKYKILKKSRSQLDLTDYEKTKKFFKQNQPDYVIIAAAKVGGILSNSNYPVEFLLDNLKIQNNLIELSFKYNVKKLLFLGSSCIYPKNSNQPIKEDYILSSYLEETNEAYSLAKITGYKLCSYYREQYGKNFFTVMPSNLYGDNDNYHPKNAHALPMLLDRIHNAKAKNLPNVKVWGTGKPLREYLHSDDLALACKQLIELESISYDIINVGSGTEISIKDLANVIKDEVDFNGVLDFDESYPDGVKRKILDSSRLNELIKWKPKIDIYKGISLVYQNYLNTENLRK